jgi:hypothetical protein
MTATLKHATVVRWTDFSTPASHFKQPDADTSVEGRKDRARMEGDLPQVRISYY